MLSAKVSFAIMDGCNPPEEMNDSLDFVIIYDVLHDVPYPSKLLEGIYKVLKTGGRFLMRDIDTTGVLA